MNGSPLTGASPRSGWGRRHVYWLLIAPALVAMAAFYVYPLGQYYANLFTNETWLSAISRSIAALIAGAPGAGDQETPGP